MAGVTRLPLIKTSLPSTDDHQMLDYTGNYTGNQSNILQVEPLTHCEWFFFAIYGPLYGIVCSLGLIGNSLSFAVLHKYTRSNVATYLLKALAISDNIFIATASFVQMYPAMSMFFGLEEQIRPVYPYIQTYAWPTAHTVQMGSVWMTVLVAANRYIAVCKPLQAPRLCTKAKVQVQIAAMSLAVVGYNIPRVFEYNQVTVNTTLDDNTTESVNINIGLASINMYNILYENVSYCLFVFLIPLVILVIFNVNLVRVLKQASRNRKNMTSKSSMDEHNITLVMIVIIIVFIICQTPASLNQILYYALREAEETCTAYKNYYHLCNLLIVMNSSVNFIIYCVFRKQFQQQLGMLLCRSRRQHRRSSSRSNTLLRSLHERTSSSCIRSANSENLPLRGYSIDYTQSCTKVPGHANGTCFNN